MDNTKEPSVAKRPKRSRPNQENEEPAVVEKIASMPEPYGTMGARLHELIKGSAPSLTPRLWYGMPAYAKEGKVVCFFRGGQMFKERYMTLGFNHDAQLDDGGMWPVAFAIVELNETEEARIADLVKQAVG